MTLNFELDLFLQVLDRINEVSVKRGSDKRGSTVANMCAAPLIKKGCQCWQIIMHAVVTFRLIHQMRTVLQPIAMSLWTMIRIPAKGDVATMTK